MARSRHSCTVGFLPRAPEAMLARIKFAEVGGTREVVNPYANFDRAGINACVHIFIPATVSYGSILFCLCRDLSQFFGRFELLELLKTFPKEFRGYILIPFGVKFPFPGCVLRGRTT